MGYRMSLGCTCEDGHYFLELDEDVATTIWMDNGGVLQGLGIPTIPALGESDDEDAENVEIEPDAFARWLDALAAQRPAIQAKLASATGRSGAAHRPWGETEFARELASWRALAAHAAEVGERIDAGWA